MRGSAAGGGELVGGPRALTQLAERIGLARRNAARVGGAVSATAAGGELLDQSADQAAMLGVQPTLQR
ncbi:MAG TPA: hypothetical protein VN748_02515 [Pseudonocardiaceae bacterium]|nr:hypothetical protein [Pseudonocardiaceae bacterium]